MEFLEEPTTSRFSHIGFSNKVYLTGPGKQIYGKSTFVACEMSAILCLRLLTSDKEWLSVCKIILRINQFAHMWIFLGSSQILFLNVA